MSSIGEFQSTSGLLWVSPTRIMVFPGIQSRAAKLLSLLLL